MSLVNYESSDDEDQFKGHDHKGKATLTTRTNDETIKNLSLPKPRPTKLLNAALADIIVTKSAKGPIRISVPSMDEHFVEDEEPKRKKVCTSKMGSSLTFMLPNPKNDKSSFESAKKLIPHSVSRPKPNLPPPKNQNKPQLKTVDIEEEHTGNFFSMSGDTSDNVKQDVVGAKSLSVNAAPSIPEPEYTSYYTSPHTVEYSADEEAIKTYDLKKLVAEKFGEEPPEDISIVDVNIKDHMERNRDWIKSISEEKPQELQEAPPNSTARRKHQITFLAYQAKQRELSLKNEWSTNKYAKSQTRAKYGF